MTYTLHPCTSAMPPGPLRALVFVHTALREELALLAEEAANLAVDNEGSLEDLRARFDWATEALHFHAKGEDAAVFPAIEERFPGAAMSFDDDHRTDDEIVAMMGERLEAWDDEGAAVEFAHLAGTLADRASLHMDKEERLLVPFIEEGFTPEEQGAMLGGMMAEFPPEFMLRGVPWIFSHLDEELRIRYATALKNAMPPEPFAMHMGNVEAELGAEAWAPVAAAIA